MAAGHRPCFGVSPFITATLSALTFRPITAEAARATTMIPGAALLGRVFASVDYCSALIFYICLLCLTVGTTLLKPEHCGVVAEFVCPKRRSFLATPRSLSPRATAKGASHHLSSLCWPPSTTRTVLLLSPPLLTTYTSQLHRIPARTRHGDLTRRFASRSVFSCIMEIACVATSFVDGLENSC